jgi:ketohexokinase
MAQILAVGIATLDIINEVAVYPLEDSEVRARGQRVQRGGNATNTLVVLSQLGHSCTWGGVLVDAPDAAVVLDDLARYQISDAYCQRFPHGRLPTSCITLSRASGSRTIVHFRDLPEYDAEHFARIPLHPLGWVHFEGRNIAETRRMMQRVREQAPGLPVSLEVEKPREHIETLFPLADVVLFAAPYAASRNLPPADLLATCRELAPQADLVCSLGDRGAVGLSRDAVAVVADACPPRQVVDTLGAGDTFNAGVIDSLLRGQGLDDALRFACALAGGKCGQSGLHLEAVPPRVGS